MLQAPEKSKPTDCSLKSYGNAGIFTIVPVTIPTPAFTLGSAAGMVVGRGKGSKASLGFLYFSITVSVEKSF